MVAECERLSRLIADLLALARAGAARPPRLQPVPVRALVEDVCRQVRVLTGAASPASRAARGSGVGPPAAALPRAGGWAEAPGGPGEQAPTLHIGDLPNALLLADRDAVRQVLLILLDNALKFASADGRVTVEAWLRDDQVTIGVRDTGPGIAPDVLPHVTERFYRGDAARSGSGAGLGLAIAKALVEAQGGTLDVESTLGEGSLFTVTLPRAGLLPAEVAV
jgi:signal transduction histidine kinase